MSANLDLGGLREKYREEKDKRERPLGIDQYVFTDGDLARFEDDPHSEPPPPREPRTDEVDVLIVGAGFGSIYVGARLRELGIDNFLIVDKAAAFGGVWYWNRYPGLRCDVESYVYLPFLEESGYMPTERYIRGPEILAYSQMLAEKYGLEKRAVFQTKVTHMQWDDDESRWIVETSRGDRFRARTVATQSGLFLRPKLPGVPGIDDFEGCAFHTSRWDYEYTGGDTDGNMENLRDKRVAFVGTGTTALQAVPKLVASAGHVTVFQRTPTAVAPRDNSPTDPEWFKSLPEGWQRQRAKSFSMLSDFEDVECAVDDGWVEFFRGQVDAMKSVPEEELTLEAVGEAMEAADYEWNEKLRARVDATVRDEGKREALKAYYRTLCKRPGFSDEYLPALDQDHVELVDTSLAPIERITKRGIVVGGVEHEFDCIVFGTGFEVGTTWYHQAGYDVECRGKKISEEWTHGVKLYQGLFSHEFPNIFFMGFDQSAPAYNGPELLDEQSKQVVYIVKHCLDNGIVEFGATAEAQAEWQEIMVEKAAERRPFLESCTPGWMNAEGKLSDPRATIANNLFTTGTELWKIQEEWRESGEFEGLAFKAKIASPG
jgi:cation diffusion facilitator CzcD-associated flavoprotein CzcO